MIQSILDFRDTVAREVMIPRTDIVAIPSDAPIGEIIDQVTRHGYTRMPVYDGSVDNIIGVLNVKDLLRLWSMPVGKADLKPLLRKPYFIPETKNIHLLLHELKGERQHMAIVIDEYGGTAGLVTLDDLIEEIVGEIRDEHDTDETGFMELPDGSVLVDSRVEIEKLEAALRRRHPGRKIRNPGGIHSAPHPQNSPHGGCHPPRRAGNDHRLGRRKKHQEGQDPKNGRNGAIKALKTPELRLQAPGRVGLDVKTASLAVLSGILLVLSFPKFGHWSVAWVALIPLLVALRPLPFTPALLSGMLAGFVQHVGLMYWVTHVVVHYGKLPLALGVPVMMLLALYLSLYTGLFAGGVVFLRKRGIPAVVAAPLLWTCLEYAKSMLLTGFPWENLAHSQYQNLPLIQLADITGSYGVSFLIVLVNAAICAFIGMDDGGRRKALSGAAVAVLLVSLTAGYGFWRIGDITARFESVPNQAVALIQGNIDQSIKWDPNFQKETLRIYRDLSLQAAKEHPQLIIWPETATPFMFQNRDELHDAVVDTAKSTGAWLIFGSPSYTRHEGELRFQNSAFVLSPGGEIVGKYNKVHLVPYGEYVPLRPLFPFIEKLAVGVGDFLAGTGFDPVPVAGKPVGFLICYEGIFPEIGRAWGRSDASLLVNVTNDAWFGMTSAPFQHLSMTTFRAVENRLYVVRAANTGVSAIIDATGRITAQTDLFVRTFLKGPVKIHRAQTFYTNYGDLFVFFCMIALLVIFYKPGGSRPWSKKFRK